MHACRSSLAAAAQVGMKIMANQPAFIRLAMYLRLVLEFPLIMMKDYVLPLPDRNVFKQGSLTGACLHSYHHHPSPTGPDDLPYPHTHTIKQAYI
jgi:hypothetical protein